MLAIACGRGSEIQKLYHFDSNFESLFSSRDYERQQLSMQLEIIYRSKQEVRKVYAHGHAHDKESVFTLNVKKFLHLLRSRNVLVKLCTL